MISGTKRWTVDEVPAAFAELDPLAQSFGFRACLFGSTMKSESGRDLDIAMMKIFGTEPDHRKFLAAFGGEVVKRFDNPERGNHSYEVARDGKLYHFSFGRF
jgi:hypothetical protein